MIELDYGKESPLNPLFQQRTLEKEEIIMDVSLQEIEQVVIKKCIEMLIFTEKKTI